MQKVICTLLVLICVGCSNKREKRLSGEGVCRSGKEQALMDIRKDKIIYCNVLDPMVPPIKYKSEMTDLLLKQGIVVQDLNNYREPGSSYCECMVEEITKRFGRYYIDSLIQLAAEKYFIKHTNDTIDHEDCDTYPAYPGSKEEGSDNELFQSRFNAQVRYPKGYRNRNDSASRDVMFIHLIVEKTGEIRIDKFIPLIRNKENGVFTEYLEGQIRNILPQNGWKPATISNHPVHSDKYISVLLN